LPELPEVETLRRGVDAEMTGRRITEVAATGARTLRRHGDRSTIARRLRGRRLVVTARRGKYLLLVLEGEAVIVVHMGMSGRLLMADPAAPMAAHTHVVLTFDGDRQLRFVDPRTFGEVFVSTVGGGPAVVPELGHLGPEPLDAAMTPEVLAGMLRTRRTKLKPLMMDQQWIVGIGNMYADEILWSARLRHDRRAAQLSAAESRRLYRAIRSVLGEAITHRGSSLADEQYRDLYGRLGGYQALHKVYDLAGVPCPRCATPVVRIRAYGRSTWYCPRCQR
jgi:formamidopyrimidine-DNA glycosylase